MNFELDKLDNLPVREKVPQGERNRCYQTYDTGRLERWLIAQRGRLWNWVYSDFKRLEWIPIWYRTYEEICYHVKTLTFMAKGKVCFLSTTYRGGTWEVEGLGRKLFYVHPESMKLCFHEKEKVVRKKQDTETMRILGDYHQFLKLGGIWYEVKGIPQLPTFRNQKMPGPHDRMIYDIKKDKNNRWPTEFWERRWKAPRIVFKKQLSSAELRQYGLTNGKNFDKLDS